MLLFKNLSEVGADEGSCVDSVCVPESVIYFILQFKITMYSLFWGIYLKHGYSTELRLIIRSASSDQYCKLVAIERASLGLMENHIGS